MDYNNVDHGRSLKIMLMVKKSLRMHILLGNEKGSR